MKQFNEVFIFNNKIRNEDIKKIEERKENNNIKYKIYIYLN